jgi:hypothetical protein
MFSSDRKAAPLSATKWEIVMRILSAGARLVSELFGGDSKK